MTEKLCYDRYVYDVPMKTEYTRLHHQMVDRQAHPQGDHSGLRDW